ncbi:MAG: hydantoinase/oxoprolinase family protein [Gammaproteobacteria bacterium]|nr:hydantoinase/oxoprolinase family protein [Gammaproteobacteria bacterium]
MTMPCVIGIDTGGTFTDFVMWRAGQLHVHKVLSTPAQPEVAILQGLHELGVDQSNATELLIVHGSTVATNAVLEGKGVTTVFITNRGFADLLTIGRQTRRELYNLQPQPPLPPLRAQACLETGGRIDAHGDIIDALTPEDLTQLREQLRALAPQAVAINLLFSYIDDRYERAIESVIPAGIFVSRSSALLPEYKEYERGITTWLNAYVGPLMQGYLARLCAALPRTKIAVMQSSGGTIAAEQAGQHAVRLLLSGPAGGLAAARFIAARAGRERVLTFDMGGTSTDVALIEGDLQLTTHGRIGAYPVAVPMVDIHTIGAGGGSIAYVDSGGVLQVGPHSAGADPGPACYGRGGRQATVTDAHLILGRLRADSFLGGRMPLDTAAAHRAIEPLSQRLSLSVAATAAGIVRIVNQHMVQALQLMSVQRGIDPRGLSLVSFGGAGGLHVCALAEALGMTQAMVPVHAGVLSAVGMIVAPRSRQLSKTVLGLQTIHSAEQINLLFEPLIQQGREELAQEGVRGEPLRVECSLDMRYRGQSYTLTVPWSSVSTSQAAFEQLHQQRYGHRLPLAVEIVNLRVALSVPSPSRSLPRQDSAQVAAPRAIQLLEMDTPVLLYQREQMHPQQWIQGPALIVETLASTWLAPGWTLHKDPDGNLLLQTGQAIADEHPAVWQ